MQIKMCADYFIMCGGDGEKNSLFIDFLFTAILGFVSSDTKNET